MGVKGGGSSRNRKLIMAVILLGMFVVMLNSVIVIIIYHSLNSNNPQSSAASLISGAVAWSSEEIISETASLCSNNPPPITAIGDQKARVGEEFALQVNANSRINNALLRYYDNTSLFKIDNSGYIAFTPNKNHTSQYVLITVKDDSGCANKNSTEIFLLTIINSEPSTAIARPKAAVADPAPSLPPEPPMLPPVPVAGISLNYDVLF